MTLTVRYMYVCMYVGGPVNTLRVWLKEQIREPCLVWCGMYRARCWGVVRVGGVVQVLHGCVVLEVLCKGVW